MEYKGGHLNADTKEKQMIGDLWERTGGGKRDFDMPTEKDWTEIERKIAA